MAFFINETCTLCDACLPECPTRSIFPGKTRYLIDRDTCHECKLCVNVCPVSAIHQIPGTAPKPKPAPPEGQPG